MQWPIAALAKKIDRLRYGMHSDCDRVWLFLALIVLILPLVAEGLVQFTTRPLVWAWLILKKKEENHG